VLAQHGRGGGRAGVARGEGHHGAGEVGHGLVDAVGGVALARADDLFGRQAADALGRPVVEEGDVRQGDGHLRAAAERVGGHGRGEGERGRGAAGEAGGAQAAEVVQAEAQREGVAEVVGAGDADDDAAVGEGLGRRGAGDERRREELAHQRLEVVIARAKGLDHPLELGVARRTRRRVGVVAKLLRPGRGEGGVGGEHAGEGLGAPARLGLAPEGELAVDARERRVELGVVRVRVRLLKEPAHRVERLVAAVALGAGRGVLGGEARLAERHRAVFAVEARAERDDERLVDGDAHLVAVVGGPVGEERGRGEEADARQPQDELVRRAQLRQVVEARRGLAGGGRAHRHRAPGGVVVGADEGREGVGLAALPGALQEAEEQRKERLREAKVALFGRVLAALGPGAGHRPAHEVRALGVERLGERHARAVPDRGEVEGQRRRIAEVVEVGLVDEGVKAHQRRRHLKGVRRQRLAEGAPLAHEPERGAGEALLHHEGERGQVARVVAELVDEVRRRQLRLLEGVAEEGEHLRLELGPRHPGVDEPAQRGGVGGDGGGLVVGRREARQQGLHLRRVGVGRDRLEGQRPDGLVARAAAVARRPPAPVGGRGVAPRRATLFEGHEGEGGERPAPKDASQRVHAQAIEQATCLHTTLRTLREIEPHLPPG
jgi:hypothetical protein